LDLKETEKVQGELDSSGSGFAQMSGSCEHGNEPWGSIKREEFLD